MTVTNTLAIEPTRIRTLFDGAVEVRLFGRNAGSTDWSTRQLDELASGFYGRIDSITPEIVHTLLAPTVSDFNARICSHVELRQRIGNSDGTSKKSVDLMRGAHADGCLMPTGPVGFWLSSADCPTLIAFSPSGRLICTHAGGKSLYDEKLAVQGMPSRHFESVIDAISHIFADEMPHSRFALICGVCAEHFKHPWDPPTEGRRNRRATQHLVANWGTGCVVGSPEAGRWSLTNIVIEQLRRHGVPPMMVVTDSICTYEDTDAHGEDLWWSHERAKDLRDGTELCRNGVLVFRR